MVAIQSDNQTKLMVHLLRRAGFGATPQELDTALENGYENVVDELLNPAALDALPDDLIRRYHVDQSDLRGPVAAGAHWIYRMVVTDSPLREKMCLFWHRVFATDSRKLIQARVVTRQIDMFREFGMGSYKDLLLNLSRDPAMIMFLDNQDNHTSSINENYGREILELFSMGVGNYTEKDIQECAKAFTGWRVVNPEYMSIRMRNNTCRPYGYIAWQYEYDDDDHDHDSKTFLGETGNFNGEEIVDIICKQDATARYIARHLYHFFVADEYPVPQWPHMSPKDPSAIDLMAEAYFDSGYTVKEMLKVLFNSDFFKSKSSHSARIKSPVEMVVGTMRLAGGLQLPSDDTYAAANACVNMGQGLTTPPSVEGWQGGQDWINTGTYVERVNFAGRILNDPSKPGITSIIDRIRRSCDDATISPSEVVNLCVNVLGPIDILKSTRKVLEDYANEHGDLTFSKLDDVSRSNNVIVAIIQLIVSSQEYQLV